MRRIRPLFDASSLTALQPSPHHIVVLDRIEFQSSDFHSYQALKPPILRPVNFLDRIFGMVRIEGLYHRRVQPGVQHWKEPRGDFGGRLPAVVGGIEDKAAYDRAHVEFCDWSVANIRTAEKKFKKTEIKPSVACSYGHGAKVPDIAAKVYVFPDCRQFALKRGPRGRRV